MRVFGSGRDGDGVRPERACFTRVTCLQGSTSTFDSYRPNVGLIDQELGCAADEMNFDHQPGRRIRPNEFADNSRERAGDDLDGRSRRVLLNPPYPVVDGKDTGKILQIALQFSRIDRPQHLRDLSTFEN